MSYIKNFKPSGMGIRKPVLLLSSLFISSLCFTPTTTTYIMNRYTPETAASLTNGSHWWHYSNAFYFPSKSQRIKNKIMRKRLCR